MASWKKYLIVAGAALALGIIIGGLVVGLIMRKHCKPQPCPEPEPGKTTTVTVIKGKPGTIVHSNWNFTGKAICFDTTATGSGKINTTVSKNQIPEVQRWNTVRHTLMINYGGLVFNDGIYRHTIGLDYYYRFGFISVGGGPVISFYETEKQRLFGGGFRVGAAVHFRGK